MSASPRQSSRRRFIHTSGGVAVAGGLGLRATAAATPDTAGAVAGSLPGGQGGWFACLVDPPCNAEIDQPHTTFPIDEHVARREVAVDQPAGVGAVQGPCGVPDGPDASCRGP